MIVTATSTPRPSWKIGRDAVATPGNRDGIDFRPDPRDIIKARQVIVHALNNGGATINHDYAGVSLTGKSGYIVGGYAPSVSSDVRAERMQTTHFGVGAVQISRLAFVDAAKVDALAYALHKYIASSPRHDAVEYVGVWYVNDRITFDVVRIIPALGDAVDAARLYEQSTIYDIRNAEDITV